MKRESPEEVRARWKRWADEQKAKMAPREIDAEEVKDAARRASYQAEAKREARPIKAPRGRKKR